MRPLILIALSLLCAPLIAQDRLLDPTRPPSPAEVQAWFGDDRAEDERAPFRLQAVLLSPDRRIAIIDAQRLRIGERIDDATLESIEPGRVVLERGGDRIELTLETRLTHDNEDFGN